jgi:uncharacterized protein
VGRQSERGGYIPGVPCWVDLTVPDPAAVLPFYRGLFGWELEDVAPEGAPSPYLVARLPDGTAAGVTALPEGSPDGARWDTYVSVAGVDETVAAAHRAGGTVVAEPFDVPGTGRMAVLSDPEGARFCIWQTSEGQGAEVVNEHGAVNFNLLATRDPDAAEAFYAALFGWRKLVLPSGLAWAMSSYGEHLEKAHPGLGEQMAQMGAPDGFVDVVASLQLVADDDADTPAHWSVIFGIDDTDAAVAQAVDLGGQVVTEPIDAPWTRLATLADPQGARFVVSQFIPENADTQ